jgi:hypothetical protein
MEKAPFQFKRRDLTQIYDWTASCLIFLVERNLAMRTGLGRQYGQRERTISLLDQRPAYKIFMRRRLLNVLCGSLISRKWCEAPDA